jgi:hypothetical protein
MVVSTVALLAPTPEDGGYTMSLNDSSTAVAVMIALGLSASEGFAAPVGPDVTITPSGVFEVCDGDQVTLTGMAWNPGDGLAVTCGRIHVQIWDGVEFVDLDKGLSDGDGFSVVFDTTGLAGSEFIFRSHFEPGGPRGVGCPGGSFRAGHSDLLTLVVVDCVEEGCSQGFWKNHPGDWADTEYSPDDALGDVFAGADFGGLDEATTLMEALNFRGGSGVDGMRRILLRQAVAAMLNSTHPGVRYPLSESEVFLYVIDALGSDDASVMEGLKDELDEMNNLGCPLGS